MLDKLCGVGKYNLWNVMNI